MSSGEEYSATFVAGYEKGSIDALHQVLALLQITVDYYPRHVPEFARALVPAQWGLDFSNVVNAFGDHCYRVGIKDQKEKQVKTAQAAKTKRS